LRSAGILAFQGAKGAKNNRCVFCDLWKVYRVRPCNFPAIAGRMASWYFSGPVYRDRSKSCQRPIVGCKTNTKKKERKKERKNERKKLKRNQKKKRKKKTKFAFGSIQEPFATNTSSLCLVTHYL